LGVRNQRLADAIRQRGWDQSHFADQLGVDPKTVERWVVTGRIPHPRLRDQSANCLGIPAGVLWPDAHAPMPGVSELVGMYPTRAELSPATITSLLAGASQEVGVLAYASMWLWDSVPNFAATLAHKLDSGCGVRVCLGDPDCAAVALRGEEEGIGDGLAARCRMALAYATPLAKGHPQALRLSDKTLYASILRFDDDILVNHHLWGSPAASSPVFHLRRRTVDGMAANAIRSFERVWADAQPTD